MYCKRKDRAVYYTPRFELNNLPEVNAFFPDGTWCGNDGDRDYFCMHRVCMPDGKALSRLDTVPDFEVDILNNAPLTSNGQLVLPPALEVQRDRCEGLFTLKKFSYTPPKKNPKKTKKIHKNPRIFLKI